MESLIRKVNEKPGLCTLEEIKAAKKWFEEYIIYRNIFLNVYGYEPIMRSLETQIDKMNWYENFHNSKDVA